MGYYGLHFALGAKQLLQQQRWINGLGIVEVIASRIGRIAVAFMARVGKLQEVQHILLRPSAANQMFIRGWRESKAISGEVLAKLGLEEAEVVLAHRGAWLGNTPQGGGKTTLVE